MGNQPSSDHHAQPMRQPPDAEADPVPEAMQQPGPELENTDLAWQAETSESIGLDGGRDALRRGREAPAAVTERLDAMLIRRYHRWDQAQSEHSSQRMELHHRIDTLGHNMGHVQESVQEFMDILGGSKFPKDIRRQLKKVQATLQSDVEAFTAQKESVISRMADLRDSDMKLDDAGHAFQNVTEAAFQRLHQATLADHDVMTIVSIASTPVTEHNETESATDQLPEELQKYYDSAIQFRFMQERLDDLYTEKAEQLTRRDLIREQDGKLDETDEEFERMWDEDLSPARQNLAVAMADLEAAIKACTAADIDMPAWDPEIAPFSTRSSSPALHDKAQLSNLVTRPAIVGSRSSFASSHEDPQAKQTIESWVVGVEPSLDAIPPSALLHRREDKSLSCSPFGIKPPSEPGGVVSDCWKVSGIRAVNSDPCLRQQPSWDQNDNQVLPMKMSPAQEGPASTSIPANPALFLSLFQPTSSLTSVEQDLTASVPVHDDASIPITGGATRGMIEGLGAQKFKASIGHLKKSHTMDSGYGSMSTRSRMQVADADFQKQEKPSEFFGRGKVLSTLWTRPEPEHQRHSSNAEQLSSTASREYARSMIRHFVVIRECKGFCNALEISTHSGNGDPQRRKYNHDFVYTNNGPQSPNDPASDTQRNGIWITPDKSNPPLHPTATVNYARLFNIDHEYRVRSYGTMDDNSLSILLREWKQVCKEMYRSDPGALDKAVQQPSLQSLGNLDFTPTQVKAILKVIDDGNAPWSAIDKVVRSNAAGQLGSPFLADMVSSSMSEGLGYSAAVSRVRHRDVQTNSSEAVKLDQSHQGVKFDGLDVDDEIDADDDPGIDAGKSFY